MTPHPASGHLLPASGEKELARDPSPREAPGEGCAMSRQKHECRTQNAAPLTRRFAAPSPKGRGHSQTAG